MKFFIYWAFFFFSKEIKESMATQLIRTWQQYLFILFFNAVMKVFGVG